MSKSKSRKPATADSASRKTCFVIMPFGGWFDNYYETMYIPAVEAAGLTPRRADDFYRVGTIINDIWSLTVQAALILADLTGKNPNVLYELGLAHAIAKPAILVSQSIEDVPFDLRALRVVTYDKNETDWGAQLQDAITQAITEVLEAPLKAVLPTFIEVKHESSQPAVSESELALLRLGGEMESLRATVDSLANTRVSVTPQVSDQPVMFPQERIDVVRTQVWAGVRKGASDESILKRASSLGIPATITLRLIKEARHDIQKDRE